MRAKQPSIVEFPTPFPVEADGLLDLDLLSGLARAYAAAQESKLTKHADRIARLAQLICAEDIVGFLAHEQSAQFRSALLNFLAWVVESVEALRRLPPLGQTWQAWQDEEDLQASLEDAIWALRKILIQFGRGPLGDRLRRQIKQTAKAFVSPLRKLIRFMCGSMGKHGLPSGHCCLNIFCQFLVPEPRGEDVYVTA